MRTLAIALSWAFGLMLLGLSLFVAAETVARKLFNFSFQGADELAGYILAIGSVLAFTIALVERGHIRIDVLHERLPLAARALLNWVASLSLAGLATFLAWYCWPVLIDSHTYKSTSATPWATPLTYPQALWLAGLVVFAIVALGIALRATRALVARDWTWLDTSLQPKSAMEELRTELKDVRER